MCVCGGGHLTIAHMHFSAYVPLDEQMCKYCKQNILDPIFMNALTGSSANLKEKLRSQNYLFSIKIVSFR